MFFSGQDPCVEIESSLWNLTTFIFNLPDKMWKTIKENKPAITHNISDNHKVGKMSYHYTNMEK